MSSRQDQLHSYQYSIQRVVAALVTHDPDPARSPLRRAGTTALVSLLIASLAVGAAAIYGLFTGHSNTDANDSKVVFQEKGTGARFVYLDSDRRLHPVLNYTSGLLLASAQTPTLKGISPEKLAAVPLGDPLGIPDAPDSLPRADALITERWSVCSDNEGANKSSRSTLLVGDKLTDGVVAARAGKAVLVRDPDEQTYLVSGNRRFAIPASRLVTTLRLLGWPDQQPWPVSAALINAIPPGPDLVAPAIPGTRGTPVSANLRVGQLITDSREVAVVLPDGQAAVTEMQARLLQALPGVGEPVDIGADFATLLPDSRTRLADTSDPDGLPATVPELADGTPSKLCITLPVDPKTGDGIRIDPTVPDGVSVSGVGSAPSAVLADLVHVARGRGAVTVVAASPSAPASNGTVSIVTDTGRQYPLASRDLLTKLGYGKVKPRQIPSPLIALLPFGPSLDPARARQTDPQ
ncbi:MAG TPA: type VII secretion protein EccB [Actinoplanes sp.]